MQDNERRSCADCLEHDMVSMKVGQVCQWMTSHEAGTKRWRERMENEIHRIDLEKLKGYSSLEKQIQQTESRFSKWFIANLTGIILTLLALLGNILINFLKTQGGMP